MLAPRLLGLSTFVNLFTIVGVNLLNIPLKCKNGMTEVCSERETTTFSHIQKIDNGIFQFNVSEEVENKYVHWSIIVIC